MQMSIIKSLAGIALLALSLSVAAQSAYEPPRTASGKPDLQGYWTNASLTAMQRNSNFDELVIPPNRVADVTASHPQNVRQATDDGLVQGQLLDGSDLGEGRG